ncbi:MAG: biotin--[acetyl-CoA-carboxylase] ligase [Flavobacteriales bacterium]|nr:biotin--[acetyl-CoA-carboxylase] ligase [Flavobacteriales bacterium]
MSDHVPRYFLESVDSTNEWAKRAIQKGAFEEGCIFQTAFQEAGKGQLNRSWQSRVGQNALFSIVLQPDFLPLSHYAYLNFTVSLACRAVCSSYVPAGDVRLKWPNDIIIQGSKVGGILIENTVIANRRISIVGIGINVNQSQFPGSLPNATSLYLQSGNRIAVDEVVFRIQRELMRGYALLRERDNMQVIQENYIAALHKLHADINFQYDGKSCSGKLVGVDELGRVRIFAGGQTRVFRHGEIQVEWI